MSSSYKQGCGVGVSQSLGFGPGRSRSLSFEGDSDSGSYLFRMDLSVILLQSVCLLCSLFHVQLKLHLYTNVHLVLEEFKISRKSFLSTRSLCHTINPRLGV